jgi:hypothetical protein
LRLRLIKGFHLGLEAFPGALQCRLGEWFLLAAPCWPLPDFFLGVFGVVAFSGRASFSWILH